MFFFLQKVSLALIFTLWIVCCLAQRVEHNAIFKTSDKSNYLRFHYDNDFFTKTDFYYTQGIVLEYGNTAIKNFVLSKLLLQPAGWVAKYNVALNLASYTPTSISSDSILYGDRPFAAIASLTTNVSCTNEEKKERLSSSFTIGVIGPAAKGNEIQTGIHRWLKNILPHGWQYQVKNDVILNYDVNYEKKLADGGEHFLLNGTGTGSIGTLHNKLNGGLNFMAGNFNDPYKSVIIRRKKVQYFFYGQSRVSFILYDATMQGGLINQKSRYTISGRDISRVTLQADAGVTVNYRQTWLSYSQSFITKEFKKGRYHRWGGVSIGIAF